MGGGSIPSGGANLLGEVFDSAMFSSFTWKFGYSAKKTFSVAWQTVLQFSDLHFKSSYLVLLANNAMMFNHEEKNSGNQQNGYECNHML